VTVKKNPSEEDRLKTDKKHEGESNQGYTDQSQERAPANTGKPTGNGGEEGILDANESTKEEEAANGNVPAESKEREKNLKFKQKEKASKETVEAKGGVGKRKDSKRTVTGEGTLLIDGEDGKSAQRMDQEGHGDASEQEGHGGASEQEKTSIENEDTLNGALQGDNISKTGGDAQKKSIAVMDATSLDDDSDEGGKETKPAELHV